MRKLHTSAFDTFCLRWVTEDRQRQKEERSREADRREIEYFFDPNWLPPSRQFSSLLLCFVVVCLSSFT